MKNEITSLYGYLGWYLLDCYQAIAQGVQGTAFVIPKELLGVPYGTTIDKDGKRKVDASYNSFFTYNLHC